MKIIKFIMDKILETGAFLSFLGMITVVTIQVVARYALPKAPPWTEEAARIFFVYTVSFAAGLAVKMGAFVSVDTFINMLSTTKQRMLKLCMYVVIALFMGLIAYQSLTYIQVGRIQTSPALRVPMSYVFASTCIGPFFIGVYSVIELGKIIRLLRGGTD